MILSRTVIADDDIVCMHVCIYFYLNEIGGILMILMTTMAFREYMNKRGRFPEPNDDDA